MAIDKINLEVIELPYDHEAIVSGDQQRLAIYIRELIESLQDIQSRIVQVANLVLDVAGGGPIYFDSPDDNGIYPEGTWRIVQSGDDLLRQINESSVINNWVTQGKWNPRNT
jgi:hypothetical protein